MNLSLPALLIALALATSAVSADAPATAPATQPSTAPAAVDVGNTRCVIMDDDDALPTVSTTYDGKIYHFCCKDCLREFKKDPAKYAKAVEADPAKYGIKTNK